jgi:hypothetical protein
MCFHPECELVTQIVAPTFNAQSANETLNTFMVKARCQVYVCQSFTLANCVIFVWFERKAI